MLRYVKHILEQHLNPVFVETGTYEGDGVVTALSLGFDKIISIEVFEGLATAAKEKFADEPKVTIIHGDSADVLWDAIKDVDQKISFWLDGHIFPEAEDTDPSKVSPLIEELADIAKHPIKDHFIMIDDMTSLPIGGAYKRADFTRQDVEDAVKKINPAYTISYFNRGGTDVLLAHVG